jgi:cell division initiation protein
LEDPSHVKLSPLDIRHMEFERAAMGYRTRQVREFLERLATESEATLQELQALRRTVAQQDAEIEGLRATEAELKRTVVAAERIGNEIKEQARREAGLVVRNAKHERIEMLRAVATELDAARSELARLDHAQALVREQLRGQLTAFLAALDARPASKRPAGVDEDGEDVIAALKATVAAARREVAAEEAAAERRGGRQRPRSGGGSDAAAPDAEASGSSSAD